jgi:membrane protein DedA with SNARE-associated domain
MENWLGHIVAEMGAWAYAVIGLGVGLECAALVGLVVPGETLAIVGGFVAARHTLSLWVVLAVVAGSAILGDNVGFEMGRRLGQDWLLRSGRHLRLKRADVERIERLFQRHGGLAVAVARFLAFGRAIAPYVAGASGMRYREFMPFNALGGIAFTLASVFVGYGFAAVWDTAHHWISGVSIGIAVAVIVAALIWRHRRQHARQRPDAHSCRRRNKRAART